MEIRDTRNGSWYWVNMAVNACQHISAHDKCVYGALASFSGYTETHPNFETISERSGVSIRTAQRSVRRLVEMGYVEITQGGGRGIANIYVLLKCPKGCKMCLESKGCQPDVVSKGCQPRHKRVTATTIKGDSLTPHIDKIDKIDKGHIAGASPAPWDLEEKLKEMEKSPNSHLDVIATFIREKPVKVENKAQLSNVISRYSRVAQKMASAYTNEQIFDAIEAIKKDNVRRRDKNDEVDYTLETVYKYLTK